MRIEGSAGEVFGKVLRTRIAAGGLAAPARVTFALGSSRARTLTP
jgi:hypothetical protein